MATRRNRVVGVDAPNPLGLSAVRDDGRVLFIADNRTTVEFEADPDGGFVSSDNFRLSLLDPRTGNTETVFSDNTPRWLGTSVRGSFYPEDRPVGTRWSRSFRHEQDSSRIVSQYRDGNYDGLTPGVVGHRVEMSGKFGGLEARTDIPETTFFDVSGAPVRENVSIIDIDLTVDGRRVEPEATFRNPANHGVDLPIAVSAELAGETIHTAEATASGLTGSTRRGGFEDRTRSLPSFTIPSRTFTDNTLTYTITPTEWADGWVNPRDTTVEVGDISVEDVSITDCAIAPQQVTVPEEVTLTATVSNPTPGRVDADVRFVLAGEETFTKQPVGGDSERAFETTYATSEPGEATGEVFLDDVVPL